MADESKDKKQKALEALEALRQKEKEANGPFVAPLQEEKAGGEVRIKKPRKPGQGRPTTKKPGVEYTRVHGQIPTYQYKQIRALLAGKWEHLQSLDNVVEAAIREYLERHG